MSENTEAASIMLLHYVFGMAPDFGGKPWSWVHYMSVRSALAANQGSEILMHLEHEPSGEWWEATLPLVTVKRIKAPHRIFGNPICHPAHAADVVRLLALLEYGGTYLDADVWCLRPFSEIEHVGWWMGRQGKSYGLCNATMGGGIASEFGLRWLESYRGFRSQGRDRWWDEHSVRVPLTLAGEHPSEITILPDDRFFYPLWTKAHKVFQSGRSRLLGRATSVHLWESKTWEWLGKLTPETIDRQSEIAQRLAEIGCLP
jgi:hypothetical protein